MHFWDMLIGGGQIINGDGLDVTAGVKKYLENRVRSGYSLLLASYIGSVCDMVMI
ncbi:MAG: hypothetical protein JNK49_05700 [Planctomycetes bacterium]|nr:hypothetical protein [Planctomycetota bacterium]